MANTVEELEAQRQQQEQEAVERIEAAGVEAEQEAQQQGLSEDEVRARVEAARKEEKDKLYSKLEGLTDRVKELQEHIRAEQREKEEEAEKRKEEAERKRQAKLSDDERQTEILARIEEQLKNERESRQALEQSLEKKEREAQLATYRASAIQAAGTRIIPELVYGKSEAEIDNAVTRAKARFEEIEEQFKNEQGHSVRQQMAGTSTSPGYEALEEQELENRLNIDYDKYADPENEDYRSKIKDQLAREYERAQGR